MEKLYHKSKISFALVWIAVYCVLQSAANPLNEIIGVQYAANALFCGLQAVWIFGFIKQNDLFAEFGLCRPSFPAKRFLFYLPLVVLMTRNFWNGVSFDFSPGDAACYMVCMACVGFVEEVIFRGFLFKAMAEGGVTSAIILSSVTFGLGHLLNLVNGSGAELTENLFQVTGAMAVGFLFVVIFYRGGSLWPCIIAHSVINMTSIFAKEVGLTVDRRMIFQSALFVIAVAYSLFLLKTLPGKDAGDGDVF